MISVVENRRMATMRGVAGLLLMVAAMLLVGGCEIDNFLDPSEVGRYENTPIVMPILDRLDVIDEPMIEIPGLSEVRAEDLIPEVKEYVMGPGDLLTVTVFELITPGVETVQTRRIDELGMIRLPVIGQIKASGLTTKQLEQRIIDILDPAILRNPMVTCVVQEGRQRTFHILGSNGAGTYAIVQPNFRLLEAIALSRGLPQATQKVYVIRQVPLSDLFEHGFESEAVTPGQAAPPMRKSGSEGGAAPAVPGATTGTGDGKAVDPSKLIDSLTKSLEKKDKDEPKDKSDVKPAPAPPTDAPKIAPQVNSAIDPGATSEGRYVNVNGKWVLVKDAGAATSGTAAVGAAKKPEAAVAGTIAPAGQAVPSAEMLVTQRVIEIDAQALMRGDQKYNIIVRPGDVIRVPDLQSGNIYMTGAINRGGTYGLPPEHQLTLKQAVAAAGGLSQVAIPQRVDLIRRLGQDQEATVRLNLRAIYDGVQPDIFLKPNDTINVGTNIYASFLAVTRNAFRMSYGFGFLLDRNFGSDVFGPEPTAVPGR